MGFCRTNLFKRLESSGQAFIQSIERHILRNYIFLHAIENDLPLPIGTQDAEMLDARFTDDDEAGPVASDDDENDAGRPTATQIPHLAYGRATSSSGPRRSTSDTPGQFKSRFNWLRPRLFVKQLAKDLARRHPGAAQGPDKRCGEWNAEQGREARRACGIC